MPHIVDDDDEVFSEEVDEAVDSGASHEETNPESLEDAESQAGSETVTDDPEVESYSKRVQKRINKLTSKTRQLEQETNFWKERVTALEAKHTAREFSEFQQQVAYSESQLKSNYETAQESYKKAKAEGDIDAEVLAHEKMLDLRDQLAEKRRLAQAAKEQADKFQQAAPTATAPDATANLPAGTRNWLKANPWFMQGGDAKAANYARQLDADLQEEGYTPDDPAMYAELDRRLHAVAPRVAKMVKSVPARPAPPKARVAGSSADGQRTGAPTKPSRTLTAESLITMRKYGFNPDLAADRAKWLHRNDPFTN
jgi:hypothetical protein